MHTADLFPLPAAKQARAKGHAMGDLAAEKTEREVDPEWTEKAVERLRAFARHQGGVFTIEMARGVLQAELPEPTDLRAWGRVSRVARAREFIEPVRGSYFPAASSNGSPKQVYRRGRLA
jgi:hypothetical protein